MKISPINFNFNGNVIQKSTPMQNPILPTQKCDSVHFTGKNLSTKKVVILLFVLCFFMPLLGMCYEQALVKRVQNYQNISVTKNLLEKYFRIGKTFIIV